MRDTRSAQIVNYKHINRVSLLMSLAAIELVKRGHAHDNSKFNPEEIIPLQKMQDLIDEEGQAAFGSEEYKRRTAILGDMTKHHYAANSHHPEHYKNGIDGMDLFDLMEMFCDWKAASERGEETVMNLTYACERFKVSPQLKSILENTARNGNFKYK